MKEKRERERETGREVRGSRQHETRPSNRAPLRHQLLLLFDGLKVANTSTISSRKCDTLHHNTGTCEIVSWLLMPNYSLH